MRNVNRLAVNAGTLFLAAVVGGFAFFASPVWAAPEFNDVEFTEKKDDVEAKFRIRDLNREAFQNLPTTHTVELWEDDYIDDDVLLGSVEITITTSNCSAAPGGGYTSLRMTHLFQNASDQATGAGNDYELRFNNEDDD